MNKKILNGLYIFLAITITASFSNAKIWQKKMDADYVREWCNKNFGQQEVYAGQSHRIDCVTDTHAVEVESVLKWQEGISQALRYGEASSKRPLLVLVVETQEQLSILRQAIDTIRRNNLKLEVEKLENFSSLEDSLAQIPGKTVKMSSSKICHVKNCGHYSATKFPIAEFDTLAECLNSGGHKADNIGEETLWACERNANNGRDSRNQMKLARTSEFFINSAHAESLENEDSQQSFCSKICSKGKACGNSCISRDKQCHKPKGSACDLM